jgi:RimJ/RimL family protein N-acetyltransferase
VIREFRPEDAAAVAALEPEYRVTTPRGLLHSLATYPPRARARVWVAEEEGRVVGFALARFKWATSSPDVGRIRGHVASHELFEQAEQHLLSHGARTIVTHGPSESWPLFEHRGYAPSREVIVSALEPRPVQLSARDDVLVRSLRDLADREHEVYSLYMETDADMPGELVEDNVSFDEWYAETLEHPDLARDGSFVVLLDDRPVALAFLAVDRDRQLGWNEMTGTLAEHRGRGLATLAKLATVQWAAEQGLRCVYTSNDGENVAMLAVNRRLGYRRLAVLRDYERSGLEGTTAKTPSSTTRT